MALSLYIAGPAPRASPFAGYPALTALDTRDDAVAAAAATAAAAAGATAAVAAYQSQSQMKHAGNVSSQPVLATPPLARSSSGPHLPPCFGNHAVFGGTEKRPGRVEIVNLMPASSSCLEGEEQGEGPVLSCWCTAVVDKM